LGVFALKNVVQLAAMVASADPLAAVLGEADVAGADVVGDELAPEVLLLLEQAATAAVSAHASTICWSVL
jgi:hypothetical protein